jgi:hypothetical protein
MSRLLAASKILRFVRIEDDRQRRPMFDLRGPIPSRGFPIALAALITLHQPGGEVYVNPDEIMLVRPYEPQPGFKDILSITAEYIMPAGAPIEPPPCFCPDNCPNGGWEQTRPIKYMADLSVNYLVGVAGFEPATPSSRTRCATNGGAGPDDRAKSVSDQ